MARRYTASGQLYLFAMASGEWVYYTKITGRRGRRITDSKVVPAEQIVDAWRRSGITPTELSYRMNRSANYWDRAKLESRGTFTNRIAVEIIRALHLDPRDFGL